MIRGEASYFERIAPPANVNLYVSLINAQLADTAEAVLAQTVVQDVGAPPIAFEIAVDTNRLDARMRYAVRAELRDRDNRLLFVSEAQPFVPGADAPLAIRLRMVDRTGTDGATAPVAPVPNAEPDASIGDGSPVRYRCGDRLVDVDIDAERVALRYDAVERTLPLARSASGARYAQDGDEFWSRGEGAMLTLGGERSECVRSGETTPWEDAKARGIAVRVVGSEPGWLAEVGSGPTPALRLSLDYGERELLFERTQVLDDARGFRGESTEVTAELRITAMPCEDPMSGETSPLTAELDVGDDRYQGCGRRLAD